MNNVMRQTAPVNGRFVHKLERYLTIYWLDNDEAEDAEPDFANLMHTLSIAATIPATAVSAGRVALDQFFSVVGTEHMMAWESTLNRVLVGTPQTELLLQAQLLSQMGQFQRTMQRAHTAVETFRRALARAESADSPDRELLAKIHLNLSQTYLRCGELELADEHGHMVRDYLSPEANRLWMITRQTLGRIAYQREQYSQAERWLLEAVEMNDISDIDRGKTLIFLGETFHKQEAWAQAMDAYERGIAYVKDGRATTDWVNGLINLGAVHYDQERYGRAEAIFYQAEKILADKPDLLLWQGLLYDNLGALKCAQGQYEEAKWFLRQATACLERAEAPQAMANVYGNFAQVYAAEGRPSAAAEQYLLAIELLAGLREPAAVSQREHYGRQLQALPIGGGGGEERDAV